ncbi:similar to Saccharomyces cerevisiae YPL015C HST2 Cytoplasmic member of the silencing information regulator 2 (Sir2) family of NAD(+)-dependent protein deacetylases [Maudiozyma barnettii]|uniref:NAD-dependent protein deacetylase n=1 Tax=Maudiozyma barnettii TaxID=61262 RepID=A0A8H2VIX1_9SACH|nr:histone deacetylase HST2 [Kazachstania barnettii]CAB4256200.1 similar to Saccharomyces cerevisiae YPL015C HST2 Cytoplasmic member of the silencing information regulator 2 (Sir2) family of NAD(+)-dependent protein deacetylases [Kazachstania barnettii]CAD1784808.1 similar to Saccharomyces cerevisiae YPL015C HST2 Cytoplasmic member of the silencing information regulator 2 (Sir2) family of NAD(+)-dependent protein deacetylases [Kazachstania barnettii]
MPKSSEEATKKLAKLLIENPKSKVIFMVGAGISTSCGIPDFRSPNTGLYHNLSKLNLPYAEAVFDIDFFKETPKPFYMLASELYPGKFKPSKFHLLMKLFQDKNRLHRIYSQNIDTLERESGICPEYVIEAHGSFAENICIECNRLYKRDVFKNKLKEYEKNPKDENLARCEECDGLVKPNIVFFGEDLPRRFFENWDSDLEEMEEEGSKEQLIVVVAGTSLTVYPFASLPIEVPKTHHRSLINREIVGDFLQEPRKSDIIIKSHSDEAAQIIAEELGWTTELDTLMEEFGILETVVAVKDELESISKGLNDLTIKDENGTITKKNNQELRKCTSEASNGSDKSNGDHITNVKDEAMPTK